ncbi:uncharacterized protein DUF4362 [Fontibacillus phaseoli]|uniref:Uncharacterized protein DUF4362 n=1 Tax=Fontibacillus phaseoli TaxID=1416533 RepID=A0A369BT37_9BACL|nr:DUF4362 domain-containing protein [Fontibacillus phaseoli]RCX23848.1 uncharacterized protein DUF4362 [Fontibacillus phaseoli]
MKKHRWFVVTIVILLTSCSPVPGKSSPASSHPKLNSSEAANRGFVVAGPSGMYNVEVIKQFVDNFKKKMAGKITLARYTDEGDPIYVDLDYNGKEISYSYDNSWDEYGGGNRGISTAICSTIGERTDSLGERNGTEYYLSSCTGDAPNSYPEKKEYFLLFVEETEEKNE